MITTSQYEQWHKFVEWIATTIFPNFPKDDVTQEIWIIVGKLLPKLDYRRCTTGSSYMTVSIIRGIPRKPLNRYGVWFMDMPYYLRYPICRFLNGLARKKDETLIEKALTMELTPLSKCKKRWTLDNVEDELDRRRIFSIVMDAVDEDDEAFRRYFFECESVVSIAKDLGMSRFGVQLQIARVLERVRWALRHKGYPIPLDFYPDRVSGDRMLPQETK